MAYLQVATRVLDPGLLNVVPHRLADADLGDLEQSRQTLCR